jgi:ligand-binding sensor domain-containing protein
MKYILLTIALTLLTALAYSQVAPLSYQLGEVRGLDNAAAPVPRLESNVIIDILYTNSTDTLWLATGKGVTRVNIVSTNPAPPYYEFSTFSVEQGLGRCGVSGVLWSDSIIWASFAFDSATTVGHLSAGGGLAYSRDQGQSWTWLDQPRDQVYQLDSEGRDVYLGYWPTTTSVQNITYDIAISDSFVWIASFAGGLRKHAFAEDYTRYNDSTAWRVVTTDTFAFHPGAESGLNHRTFAVMYADSALWVGTAGGISKSTDEGRTWRMFDFVSTNGGISGNFITALAYQEVTHTVWAASWKANGEHETYAVSKTTDGGANWSTTLTEDQIEQVTGVRNSARVHNFGFGGTTVYACDDIGLWEYDVSDPQARWEPFKRISDSLSASVAFYGDAIYAAAKDSANRLWVGGVDGLAVSLNNGSAWHVFQAALPLDDASRPVQTYAYPCPWSPARHGPVKLSYSTISGGSIKVTVYDFAMSEVVEFSPGAREAGQRYEVWDGTKNGTIVANGTYFYKIDKPGGAVWGKLIVLD